MWIRELIIKNFGKFSNKKIDLSPGINLIYGENESGKSTLHTFIRGCLYGIRKMRGRASKKDDFSHYQPWENGSYYAGSLRFVCGDKVFRLERDFAKGAGRLICETDGELLSLEDGDLDMLLGGIGEIAFSNTVFVGQLKNETDSGLINELQNYIANFQESGDRTIDLEKGLYLLKEQKKALEKQALKDKMKQEEKIQLVSNHMQYLSEEKINYERQIEEVQKMKKQLDSVFHEVVPQESEKARRSFFDGEIDIKDVLKFFGRAGILLLAISCILALLAKDTVFVMAIFLFIGLFALAATSYVWVEYYKYAREDRQKSEETALSQEDAEIREYHRQMDKLNWQLENLMSQKEEKDTQLENCRQEIQMYLDESNTEDYRLRNENKEAITLAISRLQEVMGQMQSSIGVSLKKRTSEIFREITEGYYTQVQMEENLCVGVHTMDRYIPLEQLSKGTVWQVYFAYRMASSEILMQEEPLPVMLDDAFVMYDEIRLGQVLKWLEKMGRQVVIFTCQKREKELLERFHIDFHEVILD